MTVATVRRVRRTDVPLVAPVHPDGLALCLTLWKEWMARTDTDLGIKAQSTLKSDGDAYGSDDTAQIRRDNEIAEATDAMIRSLRVSHQWAMRIHCSVASARVWRFPQLSLADEAADATIALTVLLKKNVATRTLFV